MIYKEFWKNLNEYGIFMCLEAQNNQICVGKFELANEKTSGKYSETTN